MTYTVPIYCYPAAPIHANTATIVEVGPGRGDFLFHTAKQNPQSLICAIELDPGRFDKLMRRRERFETPNVWLLQGDARIVLPQVFSNGVDIIHIHFPDPWPKRRHAKNRLMQAPFVMACFAALKPGGYMYFTTDHRPYAEAVEALLSEFPTQFESVYQPVIRHESDESFPTFFYQMWIAQGRQICYQKYRKKA